VEGAFEKEERRGNDEQLGLIFYDCVVPPPESTPLRKPRSLARSGQKRNVRLVHNLHARVAELRECALSDECSFHLADWTYEFPGESDQLLSIENTAARNVEIMFARVRCVYELFCASFKNVSNIYIGKSVAVRARFQHH
jgi:hypothetical protein